MSDFQSLLAGLHQNNTPSQQSTQPQVVTPITQPIVQHQTTTVQPITQISTNININNNNTQQTAQLPLFSTQNFQDKLREKTANKNKNYYAYSNNISAYDLAANCIRSTLFRIMNYPCESYADKWLPVNLRSTLGTAVHDFLQDEDMNIFTETELTLKVPSKRISSRLDGVINNNTVVEIKSCGYNDFEKILRTQRPVNSHFYQVLLYKYLLENHLDEIKLQKPSHGGCLPAQQVYNISHIQLVYVCHELISGDSNDMNEAVKFAKNFRKLQNSQKNPFWFMHTLTFDMTQFDTTPYIQVILDKWQETFNWLQQQQIPPMDHRHVDKKACFFCLFGKVCGSIK